ncbi:MATH and LRR domain-containing protein PFE0570w-like isoform X1 [Nasonia vitripennis]|uniref:Uncharacterized protein n=1 Tax=Nasonia vitripennis TaxID=7425 RepID=A0A7M7QIZ5_NASVI|nr:MATH and LRR domain-containing protein PFE0570w-like isoform X1 [Nasonia vitripennis]XP_031786289.1 MATH and LRR domain-containing protein PFE0570w-like isoform X1 [Nasonia vitripennis]XP_031786290.1 MATH and LRR domain-containing protein PFE0570w-like isoform X1 [Nasonia vitripennis]XP_031786291.1 MATH and LRR domain-containing protein PFE0570w-like isoform X1 [Nasonia vitripennis]XP_031786292.1 MATH and LRR domain-containing protein PFE0570w-like isoform X1 [Nasonia vitripennis]XP_0317862
MAGRGKQWPRNYLNQNQQPFYVENDDDDDYVDDDDDYENEKVTLAGLLTEMSDIDKDMEVLVEKKKAIVDKMKRIISTEKDQTSSHPQTLYRPPPSSFSNNSKRIKNQSRAVLPFTATSSAVGSNNNSNRQLPLQQSYSYNDEQRHRQMLPFEDQKLQKQQLQQLNYYQQLQQQQLLMTMTMNNNVKLGMSSSVLSESNPSTFISSTQHPHELLQQQQQQQQLQSENLMRYIKKRSQHYPIDQMESTSLSNNVLLSNNEQGQTNKDNTIRPFDEKRRRHDISLQNNDSFVNKYNYNFDDFNDDDDNCDDNGHEAQQYDNESDENNEDANNTAQKDQDDAAQPQAKSTKKPTNLTVTRRMFTRSEVETLIKRTFKNYQSKGVFYSEDLNLPDKSTMSCRKRAGKSIQKMNPDELKTLLKCTMPEAQEFADFVNNMRFKKDAVDANEDNNNLHFFQLEDHTDARIRRCTADFDSIVVVGRSIDVFKIRKKFDLSTGKNVVRISDQKKTTCLLDPANEKLWFEFKLGGYMNNSINVLFSIKRNYFQKITKWLTNTRKKKVTTAESLDPFSHFFLKKLLKRLLNVCLKIVEHCVIVISQILLFTTALKCRLCTRKIGGPSANQ